MDNPICPIDGAPMTLRTARRGSNRGGQFWGCTNYWNNPPCKGTVSVDGSESSNEYTNYSGSSKKKDETPVIVRAREKYEGYQVTFYETLALTESVLKSIKSEEISSTPFSYWSKWRLDRPVESGEELEPDIEQLLALAHKILTRGRLTLISPRVEKQLLTWFKDSSKGVIDAHEIYSQLLGHSTLQPHQVDVEIEELFVNNILTEVIGEERVGKCLLSQVEIESIAPNNRESTSSRVDFLLTGENAALVIEIDDQSHTGHEERDEERDQRVKGSGIEVLRIPRSEVDNGHGASIEQLRAWCEANITTSTKVSKKQLTSSLTAAKFIQQIQIVILEAFLNGHITPDKKSTVYVDISTLPFGASDTKRLLTLASDDLNELIGQIADLFHAESVIEPIEVREVAKRQTQNAFLISYGADHHSSHCTYFIQEIAFPREISHESKSQDRINYHDVSEENLTYFLNYLFRHDSFMEGQFEALGRVLNGNDTILLLPTGAGKSVVYQLATILLSGIGIVIDPIIALIEDQIDNLRKIGIDRVIGISSNITDRSEREQVISLFSQGEFLLCYVAPERFQIEEFRGAVRSLTTHTPICLIAIDEAHCVSEWGHDFRTSYLNIGRVTRAVCAWRGILPPLIALTGTASYSVLRDIQRDLDISDPNAIITPTTFDRKELHFNVFKCGSQEKKQLLKALISNTLPSKFRVSRSTFFQSRGDDTYCGILFCPWVGGDYGIVEMQRAVANELGIPSSIYGGKAPKGLNRYIWNIEKNRTAKEFKNNRYPLLIATKSFGMGIDKPNIRYTIHLGLPPSIEAMYQEAGRAGRGIRNGKRLSAECSVLLSNDNNHRTERLLSPATSPAEIKTIIAGDRENDDDITRAMWFHHKAFSGIDAEVEIADSVLLGLGDIEKPTRVITTFPNVDSSYLARVLSIEKKDAQSSRRNILEKAIHRLVILGIVSDYTLDYANDEFAITLAEYDYKTISKLYLGYVRSYHRGSVKIERKKIEGILVLEKHQIIHDFLSLLIQFIYEHIEQGRRRAMNTMLDVVNKALETPDPNRVIKERVLNYLKTTHVKEIEEIIAAGNEGFTEVRLLFEGDEEDTEGVDYGGAPPPKESSELRGQVSRYLESLPDHPGLLILRSVVELFCHDADERIIKQNLLASIQNTLRRNNVTRIELYDILSWALLNVFERRVRMYRPLVSELLYTLDDPEFARMLMKMGDLNEDIIYEPGVYLFSTLSRQIIQSSQFHSLAK